MRLTVASKLPEVFD